MDYMVILDKQQLKTMINIMENINRLTTFYEGRNQGFFSHKSLLHLFRAASEHGHSYLIYCLAKLDPEHFSNKLETFYSNPANFLQNGQVNVSKWLSYWKSLQQ